MNRITDKQLQAVIDRINRLTGSPEEYAQPHQAGVPFFSNVNNYHLSKAYGGVQLCRVCNTRGGISDVFSNGHIPKRELLSLMYAYIKGLEHNRD